MNVDSRPITTLLADMREGKAGAADQLIATIYPDLRRLAASQFRGEAVGHTLQPTAVVHELYVRLFSGQKIEWQDRAHFFAIAAQQIRRILVDHARARSAGKRGGHQVRVPMLDLSGSSSHTDEDVLAVHEALTRLQALDPRAAKVIELRFFGGLTEDEAAEVIGISHATLKRDWVFARAWLSSQLAGLSD
ncbi:MAG TPA: sigma-70 family RNA polymerase sigma factor [Bryobacteraceae bacterium]|nr:sigma-70 family RNA polymerase sigma factor [Bryobacteraceae bacterium]